MQASLIFPVYYSLSVINYTSIKDAKNFPNPKEYTLVVNIQPAAYTQTIHIFLCITLLLVIQ